MVNVLVTGSKGQLGSELKELSVNYKIYSFYFTSKAKLDISNYKEVDKFITENKTDVIINCAAYTNVDEAEKEFELANKLNHLAVKNLAEISKNNKIKLIHISTDYVFDGTSKKPYSEKFKTNPINKYGVSKLLGEKAILQKNPENSIIIRTSWLYSSFGDNFVKRILKRSKEQKEISVVNDQFGSPTYANDLAQVILKLLSRIKNKNTEIYHFSNEGECNWFNFAIELLRLSKRNCVVNPVRSKNYKTIAKRPQYSLLDTEKIKRTFQIEIPYWKHSLERCLEEIK